jgi:hypothetical protein
LGGEAEIGADDGEDAILADHGKETGGDHVDAGEGKGLERPCGLRPPARNGCAAGFFGRL